MYFRWTDIYLPRSSLWLKFAAVHLLYSNSWKVKTDATKNSQAIIYQKKKHLINNVTFNIYSLVVISNKWTQVDFMLTCLGNRADVDLKTNPTLL